MSEEKKDGEWILNYVKQLIDEVKEYPKEQRDRVNFHQTMAIKHQVFFSKFPHLLTKVCDDAENFDLKQLEDMLVQIGQIESGERDPEEADREMGQKYFDKYVSPHIDWEKEKEMGKKKAPK